MHEGQKSSIPLEKAEIYATITIVYLRTEKSEGLGYNGQFCL